MLGQSGGWGRWLGEVGAGEMGGLVWVVGGGILGAGMMVTVVAVEA